nr:DUF45 domain-containing protein [Propionibacterium sp.]
MSVAVSRVGDVAEPYEIRVSARRRRTLTAFREAGRLVVVVPATLSARQRRELVPPLVERFLAREAARGAPRGEADLSERVRALYRAHLQPQVGGEVPALGARWVANQHHRWGSCTPGTAELRISDRLRAMPGWVVDYVLLHEAAHLIEPEHSPAFHALLGCYPDAARAQAFLEGYEFARTMGAAAQSPEPRSSSSSRARSASRSPSSGEAGDAAGRPRST